MTCYRAPCFVTKHNRAFSLSMRFDNSYQWIRIVEHPVHPKCRLLNAYRAIKYDLDHYGTEEAWAIYDPSCISITEVHLSPTAAAPLTAV